MEVRFTPEQESNLALIAARTGVDLEQLVKQAALDLVDQDAEWRAAIRVGIEQADRGEFIEEHEMDARMERLLKT